MSSNRCHHSRCRPRHPHGRRHAQAVPRTRRPAADYLHAAAARRLRSHHRFLHRHARRRHGCLLQDKVAKAGLGRPARVVHGGDTRQQSVANALAQVDPATEIVLVHDAVRPFVTPEQIDRVIAEARTRGAAILGIPAIDTVKEVKRASLPEDVALISATIPRERIVLAQTPQVFSYALLRDAFRKAQQDDVTASDEAALVERFGHDVFVVLGSERNLKITRPADMDLARFYLDQERRAK